MDVMGIAGILSEKVGQESIEGGEAQVGRARRSVSHLDSLSPSSKDIRDWS